MHIVQEIVGNDHKFSTLSYNKEIICVVPTEFVPNVLAGIERMYDIGRNDAENGVYHTGYRDGIKDILTDIQELINQKF